MIPLTGTTRIYLYRGPTDLRKSFDGLAGLVHSCFGKRELFSGSLFVFVNRRRTIVKILYWDGDGRAIWMKKLEKGTFRVPAGDSTELELSSAELSMLLEGIIPLRIDRRYQRPTVATA